MPVTVLFICTHNSARSQMAEGLVNALHADGFFASSAGTEATRVHPAAISVMAEIGIDISGHRSKSLDVFENRSFDIVVTVCDDAARDCPFFPGGKEYIHRAFADPAACRGTDEEILACFRRSRDEIQKWIETELTKRSKPLEGQMLELRVDKFIFRFPADLYYSDAGIWVKPEGRRVRIGLSDFTQQRNGDVTFAEMKEKGAMIRAGEDVAIVETIKVNLSIPSPLTGTIAEVNGALETSPELVNQDPYGQGWLEVLEIGDWEEAMKSLKTAPEFLALAGAQAEAEIPR
jgi:arsenate reductase (thioredoxin)